jgi:hypothetical protein
MGSCYAGNGHGLSINLGLLARTTRSCLKLSSLYETRFLNDFDVIVFDDLLEIKSLSYSIEVPELAHVTTSSPKTTSFTIPIRTSSRLPS